MNILLIVILVYVIILLLIYFKTKSLKKTLTISALIFFIFMILSILVIVIDSKNLSKMEDSTSLMVLTEKGKVISAISLNFSSEEPIFFDENELNILNIKIKDPSQYKTKYFKIFIFEKEAILEMLSEEIVINKDIIFTKDQIVESLHSNNLEIINPTFVIVISDIFQKFENPQHIEIFINQYNKGNIQIHPTIKAIYLLTLFPEDMVNKALSIMPKNI